MSGDDIAGLVERLRKLKVWDDHESNQPLGDEAADALLAQAAELAEVRAELAWYGEQARLARLIHREGDAGRHALTADGGKRASKALENGPMSDTPSISAQGPVALLALEALENNQRQLDMDGVEVGVSRQALDELITAYKSLTASPPPAASPASPSRVLDLYREAVRVDVKMEGPQFMGCNTSALKRAWEADRASLASDATPAPTSGYEDASPYDDAVQGDKMLMELLNAAVDENIRLRAALAKPASEPAGGDVDFPMGAIENGRAFADRLEMTGLECEAGKLSMCHDWQEFRRCFDWLAQWALERAALSSSAGPAVEAVAWRAVAHPETGMGTLVNQIKWMLVERADSLYGPGKWDLQELGPIPAHPAPATVEMREADIARWKRDSELLSAIQDECWDVRFTSTPNADAGDYNVNIEIVSHFMAEPQERVVGENYNENLRAALEQAMTADAYPPARPVYDLPAALAPATEGRKG